MCVRDGVINTGVKDITTDSWLIDTESRDVSAGKAGSQSLYHFGYRVQTSVSPGS